MSPFTRPFRASIVARARFVEDLVAERAAHGVGQYVILGAGLDTFAQRRPELASRLRVFEIDQPGPQAWKRERLVALGLGIPSYLRLVPVDFEAGDLWWERLAAGKQPSWISFRGCTIHRKARFSSTVYQFAICLSQIFAARSDSFNRKAFCSAIQLRPTSDTDRTILNQSSGPPRPLKWSRQ